MSGFVDIPLPFGVKGYPTSAAPRFSTSIIASSSGAEQVNQNWRHPLHRFTLAEAVREWEIVENLRDHWYAMNGPAYHFPFRDPLDFATVNLPAPNFEPVTSGLDQGFGTTDGLTREFQLVKTYTRSHGATSKSYERTITLPDLDSVVILMNGLEPGTAHPTLPGGPYTLSVSRPGGVVEFTTAPTAGIALTWGGLFDVPVRFEGDDAFEGIVRTFRAGGFADVTLIEKRPCDED